MIKQESREEFIDKVVLSAILTTKTSDKDALTITEIHEFVNSLSNIMPEDSDEYDSIGPDVESEEEREQIVETSDKAKRILENCSLDEVEMCIERFEDENIVTEEDGEYKPTEEIEEKVEQLGL